MANLEPRSSPEFQTQKISGAITPLVDLAALATKWRQLESRSNCSFFQSWTWVGSFLAELPAGRKSYVVEIHEGDRLIGLGVLGADRLVRHGFVRSRALLLQETGAMSMDRVTIEYNSMLAESGRDREVIEATLRCLKDCRVPWDEFLVSGAELPIYQIWLDSLKHTRWAVAIRQESVCAYVDLEAIRANDGNYMALLSSNSRQQLKRTIKAYEKLGEFRIEVAASGDESVAFLEQLKQLHNARWAGKGEEGAFSNAFVCRFHERMVRTGAEDGSVELVRITAGDQVLGYLYNFVRDGHVYFYQSGLEYAQDSKLSPGLLCHYLAAIHYARAGCRKYDFMAGPQRYKKSLASSELEMFWFSIQKPRLSLITERFLSRVNDAVRQRRPNPTV